MAQSDSRPAHQSEAHKIEHDAYVVKSHVGVHTPGQVIKFSDEQVKKLGIDIERLLRLNAIGKASKEDVERVERVLHFGEITSANEQLREIPQVEPTPPPVRSAE